MPKKMLTRLAVGSALGFGFGLVLALPFLLAVEFSRAGAAAFEKINAPALWLAHAWTYDFSLPPRGEVAWVVVPMAAIVVHWTFLGLLIGLCRCFKSPAQRQVQAGAKTEFYQ